MGLGNLSLDCHFAFCDGDATCCVGDDELPSDVAPLQFEEPLIRVATGGDASCGVLASGSVRCWGGATMLGIGSGIVSRCNTNLCDTPECCVGDDEPASAAQAVVGLPPSIDLAIGNEHVCALTPSGEVYCWGRNGNGSLGYALEHGVLIGDDEPVDALGPVATGGPVAHLVALERWTCAMLVDGSVRCWGQCAGATSACYGQGADFDGPIGDDELPVDVPALPFGGRVIDVDVDRARGCVVLEDGAARCWGSFDETIAGASGVPGKRGEVHPADAVPVETGRPLVAIGVGASFACGLTDEGNVQCWGEATSPEHLGVLGHGYNQTIGDDEHPSEAGYVPIGERVLQIAVGRTHTCVVTEIDRLFCWGQTEPPGALGYGNGWIVGDNETPAEMGPVSL